MGFFFLKKMVSSDNSATDTAGIEILHHCLVRLYRLKTYQTWFSLRKSSVMVLLSSQLATKWLLHDGDR